jgi:hypothetical protein
MSFSYQRGNGPEARHFSTREELGERIGTPTDYLLDLVGEGAISLGGGHFARLFQEGDTDPAGFFHVHPSAGQNHIPAGEPCAGTVTFGDPGHDSAGRAHWSLVSLDPLHVEPSILCSCGRHGFVRDGRWVEA